MRALLVAVATALTLPTATTMPHAAADPTPLPERAQGFSSVAFADDPALVDPRPLTLDSWSRVAAPDVLAVNFTLGSPSCHGVHATVTETDRTVAVTVVSGSRPEAVGRMCIMIAVFGSLEVPLAAPLGDRLVLTTT